jgi:3-oxoacyl-[acyl-carrier-protein] synthase II
VTRRPVFVRGVGAFSPLGATWTATADKLAAGACGIAAITSFDATGFPCTHAASIPDDKVDEDRRLGFARRAAREAWKMAGLTVESPRLGIFLGAESGRGRFGTVLGLSRAARSNGTFDHARFGREARGFAERIDASVISPSAVAASLAGDYNAGGPVETISLACASGSAAVVEAARAIRLGQIDVALCGGVGADVDPLMLAGFGLLGILSPRGISCPFDAQRDGFIIGEGAAMLVLSADRGNSTVELAGLGRSLDAHHLTAPDPEGDGAYRAMTAALRDAGVDAVDYVQAHGTSTPLNDAIEVTAIKRALGANVDRAYVSSSKGALGHWVAGAGALGALYAWEAVARSRVLPTAGLADPDPRCDVRHVIGRAVEKPVQLAIANAFAFGGANSCLVMRRLGATA